MTCPAITQSRILISSIGALRAIQASRDETHSYYRADPTSKGTAQAWVAAGTSQAVTSRSRLLRSFLLYSALPTYGSRGGHAILMRDAHLKPIPESIRERVPSANALITKNDHDQPPIQGKGHQCQYEEIQKVRELADRTLFKIRNSSLQANGHNHRRPALSDNGPLNSVDKTA